MIDAHHIGLRQTGNETWARNISRELARLGNPGEFAWATTSLGTDALMRLVGVAPLAVGGSGVRRLAIDLPAYARRIDAGALLVQYTMPLTTTPCVVMVHDLSPFHADSAAWLSSPSALRIRQSIRRSVRRAAHLLAPSEFTRRQLVELLGAHPDRVSVAGNAVDPALATAIAHASSRTAGSAFVILAVGNVLPRKNLLVLGDAVHVLRQQGVPAELRVVGNIPRSGQHIAEQLSIRLDGHGLTTRGYITDEQLAQEYVNADVLAFPSLFEGFGIPLLEAMTAGLPAVVSDRTSLPEVAGDAALVVDADDSEAWAKALGRVHSEPLLRSSLVQAGQQRAASYTWADSARTVLAALRNAAGR